MANIDHKLVTKIHDLYTHVQAEYSADEAVSFLNNLPSVMKRQYTAATIADSIVPKELIFGIYVPVGQTLEKVAIIKKLRNIVKCSLREAVDAVNTAVNDAYNKHDRVGTYSYTLSDALRHELMDNTYALVEFREMVDKFSKSSEFNFLRLE